MALAVAWAKATETACPHLILKQFIDEKLPFSFSFSSFCDSYYSFAFFNFYLFLFNFTFSVQFSLKPRLYSVVDTDTER